LDSAPLKREQKKFSIGITNPKGKSKGVKSFKIDGNVIPFPADGRTAVKAEVTLGA